MFILGLQGSPCKQGNTSILLSSFLGEAESLGAQVCNFEVSNKNIHPCIGCGNCERTGFCVFNDDMREVYVLLRRADIVVMAAPIFFYNVPAQLKALIDRSQTLWSRKYVHKLRDPAAKLRIGFLLSLGATRGENLFEGITLTARYFFDAVEARYGGKLVFRQIEGSGAIERHPTALQEAGKQAKNLARPLLQRTTILYVCKENSCRSQMAQAFTQYYGGDKIEAESAGSKPAQGVNPVMVEAMKERGIDMAFRKPKTVADAAKYQNPERVISMGCEDACPFFPDIPNENWNLPDPAGKPIAFMRQVRDDIEVKVKSLVEAIISGAE
jgi:multimeric flavodoxin WrbA/protein-tyrosine-phosphatase